MVGVAVVGNPPGNNRVVLQGDASGDGFLDMEMEELRCQESSNRSQTVREDAVPLDIGVPAEDAEVTRQATIGRVIKREDPQLPTKQAVSVDGPAVSVTGRGNPPEGFPQALSFEAEMAWTIAGEGTYLPSTF